MIQTKGKKTSIFKFPAQAIAISFISVIITGAILLTLPISSRDGHMTGFLDALFTATSATCVTGLVVFDTYTKWSLFGQIVILLLIQIGGLGLVTLTSFFNVALGRKLGLRGMQLAQESINSNSLSDISGIIRFVVTASVTVELIGAILLSFTFVPIYGKEGIWISVFLAISGFCNAGFDILGRESQFVSLSNYVGNLNVNLTISMLIILGGLGFLVWRDVIHYRKTKKLLMHTKIVLTGTAILLFSGFMIFLLSEWSNPETLGRLPYGQRFLAAFFQSVTTRTAGFNSIDIGALKGETKILSCILMFIGAAPGSTGGGIKITTATVVIMTVYSIIKGEDETTVFKRVLSHNTVYKSLSIMVLAILGISVSASVILTTLAATGFGGVDVFFESVSAFATVGLSCGVTGVSGPLAKCFLIMLMFIGRVGPISFAISLAMKGPQNKKEILPEAKIMVG